jgi:hypothetical protein
MSGPSVDQDRSPGGRGIVLEDMNGTVPNDRFAFPNEPAAPDQSRSTYRLSAN